MAPQERRLRKHSLTAWEERTQSGPHPRSERPTSTAGRAKAALFRLREKTPIKGYEVNEANLNEKRAKTRVAFAGEHAP